MHPLRSLRRAALGAALAAAAIGAVPAMASAADTTNCSYSSSSGGVVTVNADPFVGDLTLAVVGQLIAVSSGTATGSTPESLCFGSGTFARTTNTNRIQVFVDSKLVPTFGKVTYHIDQSRGAFGTGAGAAPAVESDGNSELEITIFTNARSSSLDLRGTPQRDVITLGGSTRGDVNFGNDSDIDLSITSRLTPARISTGEGDDFISANGDPFDGVPGPSTFLTELSGGPGKDVIFGGDLHDTIRGGSENDSIRAAGGSIDEIHGDAGFDDDAIVDLADTPITGVEDLSKVGRLRLAPAVLKARAGMTARLKMSWMHPKSWRKLRKVELSLYRGTKAVGMINARPASARLSSKGAVDVMSGSKLGHHGKWVTAKLAMRLPESLAGETLRVDVTAVDTHGHEHVERAAGTIRVGS